MSVLVFDTETDGYGTFAPDVTQRVVQLGFICDDFEYSALIKGVQKINPEVPHTITVEMCEKEGLTSKEVMGVFLSYLKRTEVIVAHNIEFDKGALCTLMRTDGLWNEHDTFLSIIARKKCVCSMYGTVNLCKIPFHSKYKKESKQYKFPKLSELHEFLFQEAPQEILHDALEDCKVTLRCYCKLKERYKLKRIT